MFEKLTEIAGHTATNASRREFLGRLGSAAAAVAGVLGGLLLFPMDAHGRPEHGNPCAPYHKTQCRDGLVICCPSGTKCTMTDPYTHICR